MMAVITFIPEERRPVNAVGYHIGFAVYTVSKFMYQYVIYTHWKMNLVCRHDPGQGVTHLPLPLMADHHEIGLPVRGHWRIDRPHCPQGHNKQARDDQHWHKRPDELQFEGAKDWLGFGASRSAPIPHRAGPDEPSMPAVAR